MDSLSFKEFATCGICLELFNEDSRCPRLLLCGHTFCHSCLEKILVQSPSCPTCKAEILTLKADAIPVNYTVKSLSFVVNQGNHLNGGKTEGKTVATKSMTSKLKYEGFCTEHSNVKEFRCMDCESWICGNCGVLNHKHCRTLLVNEAYKELKGQTVAKIEMELESRKISNDKIKQSSKYMEEQRQKLKGTIKKYQLELNDCERMVNNLNSLKSEYTDFSQNLRHVQKEIKRSVNDTEFSKVLNKFDDLRVQEKDWLSKLENLNLHRLCPSTIEDLRKLCEENSDFYVEDNENEPLYGKVAVMDKQIRISSFSATKPQGIMLNFKEFLLQFSGSSDLPNTVYLSLKSENTKQEFDIVIKADGTTSYIRNFILLCSALRRHTYKGKELIHLGNFCLTNADLPPVVDNLVFNTNSPNIYNSNYVNKGLVNGNKSGFEISLSDSYISHISPGDSAIGVVTSGLQKLFEVGQGGMIIKDCGLVMLEWGLFLPTIKSLGGLKLVSHHGL